MKTLIHYTNNRTIEVKDKELREYVRYGQFWLGLCYKNGNDLFIPNIHIAGVERKKK